MVVALAGCGGSTDSDTASDVDAARDATEHDARTVDVIGHDVSPRDVTVDVIEDDASTEDAADGGTEDAAQEDVRDATAYDAGVDADAFDAAVVDATSADASIGMCPMVGPPDPACGAAACGNGQIDSCPTCTPCGGGGGGGDAGPPPPGFDGGTCCTPHAEECDGVELGGASCATLGFAGGTLGCNGSCGYDVSGCTPCGSDPRIAACGDVAVDAAGGVGLAVATKPTSIALAWVTEANVQASSVWYPSGGLHVAVLGTDLGVQHQTACIDADDVSFIALAATPSGWILAAEHPGPSIVLYPLAPDGSLAGPSTVLHGAAVPILASQPSGGPLLVWMGVDQLGSYAWSYGTLLREDGTLERTVRLLPNPVEPQYGSAVFVDDGFLVALRSGDAATTIHVGSDGSVGTPHVLAPDTEYPKLAWSGSEARALYADFSVTWTMQLVRLDAMGAPLAPPVTVGSVPSYYDPGPIAASGDDVIALLGAYTGLTDLASRLDLTRLSPAGQAAYAPFVVGMAGGDVSPYQLVPFGSDVIVAWLPAAWWAKGTPSRIGVARITP